MATKSKYREFSIRNNDGSVIMLPVDAKGLEWRRDEPEQDFSFDSLARYTPPANAEIIFYDHLKNKHHITLSHDAYVHIRNVEGDIWWVDVHIGGRWQIASDYFKTMDDAIRTLNEFRQNPMSQYRLNAGTITPCSG